MSAQSLSLDQRIMISVAPHRHTQIELRRLTDGDTQAFEGTVVSSSEPYVNIRTRMRLNERALVQMEWDDRLGLGEVIQVSAERSTFLCSIKLEHILKLDSLDRFWQTEKLSDETASECILDPS